MERQSKPQSIAEKAAVVALRALEAQSERWVSSVQVASNARSGVGRVLVLACLAGVVTIAGARAWIVNNSPKSNPDGKPPISAQYESAQYPKPQFGLLAYSSLSDYYQNESLPYTEVLGNRNLIIVNLVEGITFNLFINRIDKYSEDPVAGVEVSPGSVTAYFLVPNSMRSPEGRDLSAQLIQSNTARVRNDYNNILKAGRTIFGTKALSVSDYFNDFFQDNPDLKGKIHSEYRDLLSDYISYQLAVAIKDEVNRSMGRPESGQLSAAVVKQVLPMNRLIEVSSVAPETFTRMGIY